jgi:coenzyme PQQ synthesis protein D (PqqD)
MDVSDKIASRYVARSDVAVREVGEDLVLLDLSSGTYFTMNAQGTFIWTQLLAAPSTAQALATAVADEYDVDEVTATQDVQEFLDHVVREGLADLETTTS